jgi:hypothetical protein
MRTVGRTAVIAGTATAVSGRVNRRQQEKYSEQEAQAQQAAPPPAAAEPAAPDSDELINKLKELATLKDQGILSEDEFNAQKAKILAQLS